MISVQHPQQMSPWETVGEVPAVAAEEERLRVQVKLCSPLKNSGATCYKHINRMESYILQDATICV